MKKVFSFIRSMRFALILLILLIIACVIGSVSTEYDVYHTWWFITLAVCLCISLIACNLSRVSILINHKFLPSGMENSEPVAEIKTDPEKLFTDLGFICEDNGSERYAVRNKIGIWGAWLTHLGILIIILGFGLGQIFAVKYSVYGVPGQEKNVEGTSYSLRIDDFQTTLREDETVDQYTSKITMTDLTTGESKSGTVSVNHPCSMFGMKLYQNSMGWAANVSIIKNNEVLESEVVCVGEYFQPDTMDKLTVIFRNFYPDYDSVTNSSKTGRVNNPAYLYMLYYGEELLGMNILQDGEIITIDDYTVTFDEPQQYSLIQIKQDPFTWLALIGGIVICIALFIAFYVRTEELLAVKEDDSWKIFARSKKGGVLFRDKVLEACEKL